MTEAVIIAVAVLLAAGYLSGRTFRKLQKRKVGNPCCGCGCSIKKP